MSVPEEHPDPWDDGYDEENKNQFPDCPLCGSDEVDLGKPPEGESGAWWGCWVCGHRWKRTPNSDGSLTALRRVDDVEIPPEEKRWIR